MASSGSGHTFRTLALSKDEITLRHTMKCTAEVGITALFIFQHIFKAKFELLGLRAELDSLRQLIAAHVAARQGSKTESQ